MCSSFSGSNPRESQDYSACVKGAEVATGVEGGDDYVLKLVSLSFVPQLLLNPGKMIEGIKMRRCQIMDSKGGRGLRVEKAEWKGRIIGKNRVGLRHYKYHKPCNSVLK